MSNKRIVVTVDGLAGSGKTTLSRLLAERLKFRHLNSGLLYRAAAFLALEAGVSSSDSVDVVRLIKKHSLQLSHNEQVGACVSIDGQDVTGQVRSPKVSEATSILAALPEVRSALTQAQRDAFGAEHMVAEGRDMGTVIFPDAPVKFFIQASEEVRVKRRLEQLGSAAGAAEQMKIEIADRDRRDQSRAVAPTVPADGAIIIDNSTDSLTSVINTMYHHVLSRTGL